MTEHTAGRKLPPLPSLIASGLVILGLLLDTFVSDGLLFVSAFGAFGPGILRELGWLKDKDEFQQRAAYRAGYHAYLIGGFATVFIISALRWSGRDVEVSSEWIMLILIILWMTWLFSALLAYWGPQKTASRILRTFGSFWAIFVIADIIGEWNGLGNIVEFIMGLGMAFLIVAPFFILAWTVGRWPRQTGAALLAVSAIFMVIFAPRWMSGNILLPAVLVTATLLIVPLVACGLALVMSGRSDDSDQDLDEGR